MPHPTNFPKIPSGSSSASADALYEQARQCVSSMDYIQAGVLLNQCIAIEPGHLQALTDLAFVLYAMTRIRESLGAYRRAIKLAPHSPTLLLGTGNCYRAEGEFDKAARCYEKVLRAAPDNAACLYHLVMLRRHNPQAPLAANLHRLYDSAACTGPDRVFAGFALARLYESWGEHRRAFGYYADANASQFKLVGYNERYYLRSFSQVQAAFTAATFRRRNEKTPERTPIFVVGMPRSGTSLVEQILASHSGVYGVGEVSILPYIAERMIPEVAGSPFPAAVNQMDAAALGKLAEYFIEQLSSYCPDSSRHVVVKTPTNFLLIGLIRLLFPDAPIIHCMRDPMDTCWSLFRQYFIGSAHAYCYQQQALGKYYRSYQQLMRFWHGLLPGEIHDVRYEELVAEPGGTIRALLGHCRLSWEEKCLAFYRTRRIVSTASDMQVRRPIYNTSIKSWLPVADDLKPLQSALRGGGA